MVKRFSANTPSPRQEKISSYIHELIVSMLVKDEIINLKSLDIVINSVSVSPDLRNASIFVTPIASGQGKKAKTVEKIMKNLINAQKFIRTQIAKQLTTKVCPELKFYIDQAPKNAEYFDNILNKIKII
jgi:ribosome-binding factor A